ncbi:MAG: GNAT family N-acetyltransferase [Terrimesophilobacter sp.]
MSDFTIDELTVPASVESAEAADFIQMSRVRNEIEALALGTHELAYEPAELLPDFHDPYQPQRVLLARVDGTVVGCGGYEAPLEEGSVQAWLRVEVLPQFRCRGIGGTLYERLVELAADDGRTTLQAELVHTDVGGRRLLAPTGFGSVPRGSAESRFLRSRGFRLEQVERVSRLALPLGSGAVVTHLAAAEAAAGADYRTVAWVGTAAWEGDRAQLWLTDLARLHAGMSTDAPSAGLDFPAEIWDAERVRTVEVLNRSSPRRMLHAAVEHVPSGRLVAFNELSVPPDVRRGVEQQDTLVQREHRGHRLGMLVKVANLLQLQATHPGHPSVTTFNAEENRYMLTVNEALGFVPIGYAGGWKKTGQGRSRWQNGQK